MNLSENGFGCAFPYVMVYDAIMRAGLILDSKTVLSDGRIVHRRVWQLPNSTADRPHGLKYNL